MVSGPWSLILGLWSVVCGPGHSYSSIVASRDCRMGRARFSSSDLVILSGAGAAVVTLRPPVPSVFCFPSLSCALCCSPYPSRVLYPSRFYLCFREKKVKHSSEHITYAGQIKEILGDTYTVSLLYCTLRYNTVLSTCY